MRHRSPVLVLLAVASTGLSVALAVPPAWAAPRIGSAAAPFTPVADAYVDAGSPTTTFGTAPYLRADNTPARRAYLRFSVQGVGRTTSTQLRVYAETSNRAGLTVSAVASTTWAEDTLTYANAPALGVTLDSVPTVAAGHWVAFDVAAAVTGDGLVSFALTTNDGTALRLTSREGANPPQLLVPAPPSPSPFTVSRVAGGYRAESAVSGTVYTGSVKSVVEDAVADLRAYGGAGTVQFSAGVFELGTEYFKLDNVSDLTLQGAGMDLTVIRNRTDAAADTEPFNFSGAFRVTVRDLAVSAEGAPRTTSDALDFDQGNDVLVERVRVVASRGRGIVFDGKNAAWTSERNTVRDCVITGAATHGIELLASSQNRVEGCTIRNVGGHGIEVATSSAIADQPNKKSNDNVIARNVVDQAGRDGINVLSSDRNRIVDNVVTNSSDETSGRDGIRITVSNWVACDDNVVSGNTSTDNQFVKTQRYGLDITAPACHRTVVGPGNSFAGNLSGPLRDLGTGTTVVT